MTDKPSSSSPEDQSSSSRQTNSEPQPVDLMPKPFTKKNWDAIIDEFEKEEGEEQGVKEMFQQIYESGDDEVRRAMNKSFQESAGTVLSTVWSNVANQKVEPSVPKDKPTDDELKLL